MKKRILSLLLALTLLIGMMPTISIEAAAATEAWLWPVKDCYTISSNFGWRVLNGSDDQHRGIDIANGTSDLPIRAAKSGTVITSLNTCSHDDNSKPCTCNGSAGNYIVIKHNDGTYSRYLHLRAAGMHGLGSVNQGDVIGYMGSSGQSYGYHLHFDMCTDINNRSGTMLNPMPTNSEITIKNSYYSLPEGWPAEKTTYVFDLGDDHIEESYPCYGKLTVTAESKYLKSLPCSAETDANSVNVGSEPVVKGDELTAIGLYMNDKGNLWYKAISDQGEGYIFADNVTYTPDLDWDFAIRGIEAPTVHQQGSVFYIKGKVSTMYQRLVNVGAWVEDAYGATKTGTILDVDTNFYDFDGSDVDKEARFNDLPIGNYTYYIGATVRSYYAKSAKEYGVKEKDHYFSYPFTVVKDAATTPVYTITLDANGGSCTTSSMTVAEGTMVGTLPTPTRNGYEFLGWYENNYAGYDPVTSDTIITGNTTYYAHWQSSPAGRTKITFDTNGGLLPSCYAAVPINGFDRFRDTAELIVYTADNMVNRHNEFGVSLAVNSDGLIVDKREYGDGRDITIPNEGFVIGVHVDSPAFYDIGGLSVGEYIAYNPETMLLYLYESENACLAERKYMTPEDSYYALPIPTKYGYVFDGWYTASGVKISWSDYLSDTTLYAHWVENAAAYPSYVYEPELGHIYERFDFSMSWEDAKAFCESRGGHLVAFGSAEEQNDLFDIGFFNGVPYGQYFIGATDAQEEGTWRWVNDEEFSYSSWNQSIPEPNNASANEHYAVMVTGEWVSGYAIGEWLDVSNLNHNGVHSTYATGFICEYDTIEYCTIFFDVNGGTYEIDPQTVTCGVATQMQMDVPYRFGYTFQGWSTSSAAKTVDYRPGDIVTLTEDLYLYAVWQEPAVLQTPEQSASLYVENIYGFAGAATHYRLHCTESGSYLFRGMEQSGGCDNWICLYDAEGNYLTYNDNGGYYNQFRLTYDLTEGETYYVSVGSMNGDARSFNFSIAHGAYITYDANGGEGAPESHWIYWDDIYPYLSGEEPTREGYEFLGWSTNPNATHPEYDWQNDQYTANVDVTLYAVWASELVATPGEEEINPGENMYIILDYYGDEDWEDWDWEAIMNLISGVYIDDQPVDREYYFFEEGPFMVWVKNEALAGLAEGEYTMRLETSLGNAEFRFRISYEDEVTASGTLDNISWEIRNDILIFSGTGAMPDFPEEEMERPWNGYNYYGVEIRDGITYVGAHTLKYREWVLSLTMADSVTEIGEGAFANQMRMKDVKFSENLTVIGEKAFCCSGVGNIVLPDTLTTIGAWAFAYSCISQISLPAALTTIGDHAFDHYFDIVDVYYDGTEAEWAKVVVGTGNESLLNATFHFVNPFLYGDVNGDGNVNTKDRMVLTRYLAGMTGYTADMIDMKAADVNCDGTVNAKDRMILTRYLAQWTAYPELPHS